MGCREEAQYLLNMHPSSQVWRPACQAMSNEGHGNGLHAVGFSLCQGRLHSAAQKRNLLLLITYKAKHNDVRQYPAGVSRIDRLLQVCSLLLSNMLIRVQLHEESDAGHECKVIFQHRHIYGR